ncbi:RHS repeat-associated core domain-containing protein, partial [Pseudomarimonas arenosa]
LCSVSNSLDDESGRANTRYSYDELGQLTSLAENFVDVENLVERSIGVSYKYDTYGRLYSLTYANGVVVTYSYAGGMVSAINARVNGVVRTILTNVSYRSAGRPSGFTYGNGAVRQLTYGWDNRLQSISTGALQSLSYGYDANDRMSSIANGYDSSTQTFGYDDVDRLTMGQRHDGQDEYWSYDSIGHRQTHNRGGSGFGLTYQGNWLRQVAGGSVDRRYQIDALGNRTQLTHGGATEGTDFYYDPFQRQRWVVRGTNQTECDTARAGTCPVMTAGLWTYGYNHAGQRTYRSDHSPPSRFQLRRGTDYFSRDSLRTTRRWIQRYLHAPSGELLAETAPNSNTDDGAIASVYVYFSGQPVAVIRNGAVHYIYNDHLGRPEVVANSANQPVWRAKNYAFHREVMQQGGSFGALNLGFPGQYYDAETNLYYNWHRYYDPSTGRYTQADPIGLVGGVNRYGYASGNPVGRVDPLGLKDWTECETDAFLEQARNELRNPVTRTLNAIRNHLGYNGGSLGKFDFRFRAPDDRFMVDGVPISSASFGNYIAGYTGVHHTGPLGHLGVLAGGIMFDVPEDLMRDGTTNFDADSRQDINNGAKRAWSEVFRQRPPACGCSGE